MLVRYGRHCRDVRASGYARTRLVCSWLSLFHPRFDRAHGRRALYYFKIVLYCTVLYCTAGRGLAAEASVLTRSTGRWQGSLTNALQGEAPSSSMRRSARTARCPASMQGATGKRASGLKRTSPTPPARQRHAPHTPCRAPTPPPAGGPVLAPCAKACVHPSPACRREGSCGLQLRAKAAARGTTGVTAQSWHETTQVFALRALSHFWVHCRSVAHCRTWIRRLNSLRTS